MDLDNTKVRQAESTVDRDRVVQEVLTTLATVRVRVCVRVVCVRVRVCVRACLPLPCYHCRCVRGNKLLRPCCLLVMALGARVWARYRRHRSSTSTV